MLWEVNTNGECGKLVACKSMMSVLGPGFIFGLLMTAQKVEGSRTCVGTTGKNILSVNYSNLSFVFTMK